MVTEMTPRKVNCLAASCGASDQKNYRIDQNEASFGECIP